MHDNMSNFIQGRLNSALSFPLMMKVDNNGKQDDRSMWVCASVNKTILYAIIFHRLSQLRTRP